MARKLHKALRWERQRIAERQHQIHILSDVLYALQRSEGKDFLDKKTWHWGCGIKFTGLSKLEFKTVKSVLPKLSKLNKNTTSTNYSLSGRFGESPPNEPDGTFTLSVEFTWDLPETCKVTYKDVISKAGDSYFIEDGTIMWKTKEAVIDCGDPLIEAVFRG
jgi:hypothetical protein